MREKQGFSFVIFYSYPERDSPKESLGQDLHSKIKARDSESKRVPTTVGAQNDPFEARFIISQGIH